jgi:acetyl-CoA C-acetyltransferase
VPKKRGGSVTVVRDDEELARTDVSSLSDLMPAFLKDPPNAGTVTAGNASPLSDGAAALVLTNASSAEKYDLEPLAEILGYGDAETAPELFTTAPSLSLPVAVKHAGLSMKDVDLFELNEAFAVVALANMKLLGIEPNRVNVFGGAVALGHPLGCSGARIVVTLINALRKRGGGIGAAAVCNGGGGSSAIVLRVIAPR